MTLEEFKNFVDPKDPNRDRSGIAWIENNNHKFFTHTSERSSGITNSENIFDYSVSTLYKPNLIIKALSPIKFF